MAMQVWIRDLRSKILRGPGSDMARRRSGPPHLFAVSEEDASSAHAVLVDCELTDTIGDLKESCSRRFDHCDPDLIVLIINHRELRNDEFTLAECGIVRNDTLFLRKTLNGMLHSQKDEVGEGPLGGRGPGAQWRAPRAPPLGAPPRHAVADWTVMRPVPRKCVYQRSDRQHFIMETTAGSREIDRPHRIQRTFSGDYRAVLQRLLDTVGNPIGLPGVDTRRVMREAFDALDIDGSGTIDANEFEDAFLAMDTFGVPEDKGARRLFALCDRDADGRLSFPEFCLLVSKKLQL
eukprot:TRINITY_DN72100_c0_g1_i1.p1 TRINITY_DN72100_c0_g1~~TRINITY_DN72100_c0_g1_i1.p1  ORF type:complete len:292 (+),score=87.05 TRINITY_DN72100_c0_g1_i1:102-977(+)